MDAVTPWPALVKRLRFLSSLKQCELAQQPGVDQGSVSRWERGIYVPDIWVQKRLRDMLHKLEPVIDPAAIEAMPVRALLYCAHTTGLLCAASHLVAEEHGFKPVDMRHRNVAPMWPDSVRQMHETLDEMDAWRSGDVALVRATIFRINNQWCDTTGMPVPGADLVLFTASIADQPPADVDPSQCRLNIITKDELIS
jgi:DNA-binding XRE family transcriptional regulator